jgi:hypothetical protein
MSPREDTCLSLSGLLKRSLQQSFLQPICGDPASCIVPKIMIDAWLMAFGLSVIASLVVVLLEQPIVMQTKNKIKYLVIRVDFS